MNCSLRKHILALSIITTLANPTLTVAASQWERISAACDEQSGPLLAHQQLEQARSLDNPVKRIAIMIRAADLLWPRQQDSARAILTDAYNLASEHFQQKGDETRKEGRLSIGLPDQRFVVMRAIAKRDPAWARQLAKRMAEETKQQAERAAEEAKNEARKAIASPADRGNISEKILTLAESMLTMDLQAGINLARSSFSFPASAQLPWFLFKLAESDPTAANQLFHEALRAYANGPVDGLFYLSVYPFALSFPVGPVNSRRPYQPPQSFITSSALQRLFLDALLSRAQASVNNPDETVSDHIPFPMPGRLYMALTRLEPLIAQNQPDYIGQASSLRASLAVSLSPEFRQQAIAGMRSYQIEPPDPSANSLNGRLEDAGREANPSRRDTILATSIINAPDSESIDRLLDAAKKIGDDNVRRQIVNWTYFKKARQAVKDKQFDDARQLAEKVDRLDQRAYLAYEVAAQALEHFDDKTLARETLNGVAAIAHKADETNEKARALLGVVHLYAKFDPLRAFEVMSDTVKSINKLAEPDFTGTTIRYAIEGKDFGFYASLQIEGFSLESVFRELGQFDFDHALLLAKNLEDKSLRSMSVISLAAVCMENIEKLKKEKARESEQKKKSEKPRN